MMLRTEKQQKWKLLWERKFNNNQFDTGEHQTPLPQIFLPEHRYEFFKENKCAFFSLVGAN
jgi:hypothetical protein